MSQKNNFREVFNLLYKDGKLLFIILATILAAFSIYTSYVLRTVGYDLGKYVLISLTFSFSWVLLAWAVTDKSILRKARIYAFIYAILFIEKIYWGLFYHFYKPSYEWGTSEFGLNFPRLSEEWLNLQENAYYLSIVVTFVVMLGVFLVVWYLAKPKEFKKCQTKSFLLIGLSAFLMTMPAWIFRFLSQIGGESLTRFIVENIDFNWFNFVFEGIPIALALVVFACVITNIKVAFKNILYVLIFVFSLIIYIPFYYDLYLHNSIPLLEQIINFAIIGFCYFVVFLSLLLLSKSRYIED